MLGYELVCRSLAFGQKLELSRAHCAAHPRRSDQRREERRRSTAPRRGAGDAPSRTCRDGRGAFRPPGVTRLRRSAWALEGLLRLGLRAACTGFPAIRSGGSRDLVPGQWQRSRDAGAARVEPAPRVNSVHERVVVPARRPGTSRSVGRGRSRPARSSALTDFGTLSLAVVLRDAGQDAADGRVALAALRLHAAGPSSGSTWMRARVDVEAERADL